MVTTEARIVPLIRLALSRAGAKMFRNNIGLAWYGKDKDRPVRYGLVEGSGDFIGWVPVEITPDMLGKTVAVFCSVECKRPQGGRISWEQKMFIDAVLRDGGFAGVARSPEEAVEIISALRGSKVSPNKVAPNKVAPNKVAPNKVAP